MKNLEKLHHILGEEVYYEFMAEYYTHNECNHLSLRFEDHLHRNRQRCIILAFSWISSELGIKFWSKRHREICENWESA